MKHLQHQNVERDPLLRLSLQFFAEGAAEGGAEGSAGGGEASPAGEGSTDTSTTQTDVGGGKTYSPEEVAAVAKQAKMIPHNAVRDRFKSTFDKADKYDAMLSHMGAVSERYGVSLDDPAGLAQAILNDKALIKAKATELGVTEEIATSLVAADATNAIARAKEADRVRREEFGRMADQEKAVKDAYPHFDLSKASENPAFKALVDSGLDMKSAYEMSHHAELTTAAIAAAKEQAKAEARAELEAAAGRPGEGATRHSGNAPTDVSKLQGKELDAFLESFLTK